jgi:cobalt/nickel transport system ATP-binding protein
MSCKISYNNVHYTYPDGTRALRGVSFELQHGQHVALLGPNGAGKSTIMLLSNGVLMPEQGSIIVGHDQLSKDNLVAIRQRVGLLFQDPDDQLFMSSIYDDIAFGPLNQGLPAAQVEQRVQTAIASVELGGLENKPAQDLSFGQRKRAALATILAMQPDFLILDEPSSNLDPHGRRQMMQLLAAMEHTVLLATHDLTMVWDLCDFSIIIDQGEVVASGSTHSLLRDEALLESHGLELPAQVRYSQK